MTFTIRSTELEMAIQAIASHPLYRTGAGIVNGRSIRIDNVLIIGEAPGLEPRVQCKRFVGAAGPLLDRILQPAGFAADDHVSVTYLALRRPLKENRKGFRPLSGAEEVACHSCIVEIVRAINPSCILLTGRLTEQSILHMPGLADLHSQLVYLGGRWALPIFDSSELLQILIQDLALKNWRSVEVVRCVARLRIWVKLDS